MSKAIVLSGGGSVGIAWQTGLCLGLSENGVEVSGADLVVGTSAGSAVGAQIALGRDMREGMARYRPPVASEPPPRSDPPSAGSARPARAQGRMANLVQLMAKAAEGDPKEARRALGKYALEADTIDEAQFKQGFAHLEGARWPKTFTCTGVDTESGAFAVWNEASGVDLVSAVAASCSVPGLFPPITIQGRRYMDGGMRSGTNADLAKGHGTVLVVTLMGGWERRAEPSEGDPDANARMLRMRRNIERERGILEESGARVLSVSPDAQAASVMGMDLMNGKLAYAAAQEGLRQGRAEAARVRELWQ